MPDSPVINDSDEFTPMPLPGGVVRQEQADELTPVPFQFSDIRALAAKILKRAQEQAQQKLEAARAQIAAMEKEAQDKAFQEAFPRGEQEGFKKGEAEGKAQAQGEIKKAVEEERASFRQNAEPVTGILQQLANTLNEQRQDLVAQAEADLLLLALDLAKRLVGHELSVDPEAIRPLATEAIGLVTDRSSIVVRVNPADHKVLEENLPDIKLIFPDLGMVQIESDASVERGGLIVATREAEVDMRLATRLAAFEEAILGFSGKDAEAPWDKVDPNDAARQLAAIDAAKAASRQASPYSLDALDSEDQPEEAPEPAPASPAEPVQNQDNSGAPGDMGEMETAPTPEPAQNHSDSGQPPAADQDAPPPGEPGEQENTEQPAEAGQPNEQAPEGVPPHTEENPNPNPPAQD